MTVQGPYAEVTFWGTRGSISTPGRKTEKYGGNTPCVTVQFEKTMIVIDAGTGLRMLGNYLIGNSVGRSSELSLLLTHTHWDHIQGLPFFLPAYLRGTTLTVYGSSNKGGFLESILRGQMDYDYFPVDMSSLGAEMKIVEVEDPIIDFGAMSVKWEEQIYHPGGCLRFSFEYAGKKIVFASDVELNMMFGKDYPTDEEKEHAQQYLKFIQGADLLIGDGQYTDAEYPSKETWGHTSMELLMEVAYKAGVKKLAVFHHDPDHSDELLDELWQRLSPPYEQADPPMQVFWAREGMSLPI